MTAKTRSLSDLLVATANELSDLSTQADQLGGVGIAEMERWQALDRMSQYLSGMSLFLARLAGNVPHYSPDITSALSVLTTTALADRLAGYTETVEEDAGSMELFGA